MCDPTSSTVNQSVLFLELDSTITPSKPEAALLPEDKGYTAGIRKLLANVAADLIGPTSGLAKEAATTSSNSSGQFVRVLKDSLPEDDVSGEDASSSSTAEDNVPQVNAALSQDASPNASEITNGEATGVEDSYDVANGNDHIQENMLKVGRLLIPAAKDALGPKYTSYEAKQDMIPHLLRISQEVRDLVYQYFFPRAATVNLTEGYSITAPESLKPVAYTWSKDASNLLLSCRKVYEEAITLVYRTNTFVLTPWAMNYNYKRRAPHSNTEFWLSSMRLATKCMVKKLHIYLPKPALPQRVEKIADGLASFPKVEITIMPISTIPEPTRSEHRQSFETLCQAVEAARIHPRPILWNDGGDLAAASMLSNMPIRPLMRRPTALEIQAQIEADKES